jgi:type IV secretion system protein VirD4
MRQYDILLGKVGRKLLSLPGSEHVALHARTGAGKGVSFVIPNCLSWPGSLVVLDIKGEAFRATAGHRAAMGQDVYLFDPAAEDGHSHRWDPFAAVNRTSLARFRQIQRQANLLFPEIDNVSGGGNHNKFWDDAGRQAFAAVAAIVAETPDHRLTMENVTQLFMREDGYEWLSKRIGDSRRSGQPLSKLAVDGISDYVGSDPKLRADIRKTVSTRLQTWYDPQIAAVTSASDFDLRDLRRKPMTIYVAVAPGNIPRLRPLLRLFFDAAVNLNTDATPEEDPTLKIQTLFMLDEFARLGRMDTLAQAAQFVRAYGIRMAFVIQNKAQLRAIYGKDGAADVFDNLGAEVVFGTTDPELTKELEERLGDSTVTITTRNRPRFLAWMQPARQGAAEHPHRRPLMLDQEVARMSPDQQLIIRPGMRPMKTERICWYTDRAFRSRPQPAPEIPALQIDLAMDATGWRPAARQSPPKRRHTRL